MEQEIAVTIITVSYNSEKTIERTIKSVLSQSYGRLEYILVDGSSKDGTVDIIRRYAKEDKRVRFVSEPDQGIYDAMNKGIRMATGELIGIINSDDWYEPEAVSEVVRRFLENERRPAVYYGAMGLFQDGLEKACLFYHHHFLPERMINHPSCFVAKSLYDELGVYDTRYKLVADYEFMLRVFFRDESLFIPVHERLANFSAGSFSGSVDAELETDLLLRDKGLMPPGQYRKRRLVRTVKKMFGYS
ncbi:MAG: glycosyltransferase [Lachnospiraceae bacterium]|nr:glycosyltransferase [Lachnospiraceae bacterium]